MLNSDLDANVYPADLALTFQKANLLEMGHRKQQRARVRDNLVSHAFLSFTGISAELTPSTAEVMHSGRLVGSPLPANRMGRGYGNWLGTSDLGLVDPASWRLVELRGIEPLTSAVRLQRSPI